MRGSVALNLLSTLRLILVSLTTKLFYLGMIMGGVLLIRPILSLNQPISPIEVPLGEGNGSDGRARLRYVQDNVFSGESSPMPITCQSCSTFSL